MGRKVLYKTNFYFNFFENKEIPSVYSSIHYKDYTLPFNTNPEHDDIINFDTFAVELFPTYFDFHINDQYTHELQKIFRVKGHCISLEGSENAENYLKKHFKPNFRTSIRRRLKALEKCFNVSYKMLYGNIELGEYDFIMNELRTMLIRRFAERNDENMALGRWKDYYASTFELIKEKKASLFVIYDDAKPIQISLSYHCDKILFLSIPSYNIDYSKFGLGNISVLKILEWCIVNEYEILDMGYGAFDYKLKWCNETYDFEHHVFYTKSSLISQMLVLLINLKTRLINYLLAKRINIYYHRLKAFIFGKKTSDLLEFKIENIDLSSHVLHQYKIIDPITDETYAFLRRAIYDFLYINLEHISQMNVYELEKDKSYFIKGTKQTQKISYKM